MPSQHDRAGGPPTPTGAVSRRVRRGVTTLSGTATPADPFSLADLPNVAATVLLSRDVSVLILLARFRALSFGQLQELLCGTDDALAGPRSAERVTYRVLGRLRRRGLLTSSAGLHGNLSRPTHRVYLLTTHGRHHYHLLDPRFPVRRIGTPSESSYLHQFALTEIALAVRAASARHDPPAHLRWEADWEVVERLGTTRIIPDALLTWTVDKCRAYGFIEADRATERGRAFEDKIKRYLDVYQRDHWRAVLPVWPLILTVTTTPLQARRLRRTTERAVERSGQTHLLSRFRFTSRVALTGPIGFLGPIWEVAGRAGLYPPLDPETPPTPLIGEPLRRTARPG